MDSVRAGSRQSGHWLRRKRSDEAPAAEPPLATIAGSAPPSPSCLRLGRSLAPPCFRISQERPLSLSRRNRLSPSADRLDPGNRRPALAFRTVQRRQCNTNRIRIPNVDRRACSTKRCSRRLLPRLRCDLYCSPSLVDVTAVVSWCMLRSGLVGLACLKPSMRTVRTKASLRCPAKRATLRASAELVWLLTENSIECGREKAVLSLL